jgi:hypothetical protein
MRSERKTGPLGGRAEQLLDGTIHLLDDEIRRVVLEDPTAPSPTRRAQSSRRCRTRDTDPLRKYRIAGSVSTCFSNSHASGDLPTPRSRIRSGARGQPWLPTPLSFRKRMLGSSPARICEEKCSRGEFFARARGWGGGAAHGWTCQIHSDGAHDGVRRCLGSDGRFPGGDPDGLSGTFLGRLLRDDPSPEGPT